MNKFHGIPSLMVNVGIFEYIAYMNRMGMVENEVATGQNHRDDSTSVLMNIAPWQ